MPTARESAPAATGPLVWEHYVTHPFPERIPHADATVDEVRLTGSFNADLSAEQRRQLVSEAARVLKPGGKIVTHGLMGDRPLPGAQPKLPGLAARVARVPAQAEPIDLFRDLNFVGVQIVKYTEKPWFMHDGVGMREVKVIGWKPTATEQNETRQVLYKGPFAQVCVDGGYVFSRGKRVSAPLSVCNQLRLGASAEHFLLFEAPATARQGGNQNRRH
jgi:hypothetical protein